MLLQTDLLVGSVVAQRSDIGSEEEQTSARKKDFFQMIAFQGNVVTVRALTIGHSGCGAD